MAEVDRTRLHAEVAHLPRDHEDPERRETGEKQQTPGHGPRVLPLVHRRHHERLVCGTSAQWCFAARPQGFSAARARVISYGSVLSIFFIARHYTIDSWGMRDNAPDSGGVQGVVAVTANAMNPN